MDQLLQRVGRPPQTRRPADEQQLIKAFVEGLVPAVRHEVGTVHFERKRKANGKGPFFCGILLCVCVFVCSSDIEKFTIAWPSLYPRKGEHVRTAMMENHVTNFHQGRTSHLWMKSFWSSIQGYSRSSFLPNLAPFGGGGCRDM